MENVYNLLKTIDIYIERSVTKNSCRKCKLIGDKIENLEKRFKNTARWLHDKKLLVFLHTRNDGVLVVPIGCLKISFLPIDFLSLQKI